MTTTDFQERVQESAGGDVYIAGEGGTCQVFCRVNIYCSIEFLINGIYLHSESDSREALGN